MQWRHDPGFLGSNRSSRDSRTSRGLRLGLPQLPASLEAAAVVAAVMGFGLGWAWLAGPAPSAESPYPELAMSLPGSPEGAPGATSANDEDVELPVDAGIDAGIEEWLVDGFNLLHTALLGGEERDRWWTATGRGRVLEAVAGATNEHEQTRVWIVFDGSRPAPETETGAGRLHSVFAPSADDWLVRRVRESAHPERMVVVTADRRLASRARHHGASVVTPGEFLARTAQPTV